MEVQNIRIDLISPSPLNPRKTFDEAALEELASNIEKQGLLQPITVRVAKSEEMTNLETGDVHILVEFSASHKQSVFSHSKQH